MPEYRRMKKKHREKSIGAFGEDPEHGAIFMSNNSTRKECLRRELFGLPMGQAGFVKQVKAGMMLFLFEFESRELHGVFQACSDGAINIEPDAYLSSGKQFPAQVKFTEKWRCRPLCESEFRHAIRENYFTATKFNFGLSAAQVRRLLKLFSLKKIDRSRLRETAVAKSTRKSESNLRNTVGDRVYGNRCEGETDGDVDREFPGDFRGHRLTKKSTRKSESNLKGTVGDRLCGTRCAGETDGDVDLQFPGDLRGRRLTENYGFKDESAIGLGDLRGRGITENYGFGDESDIGLEYDPTKGNEYSGDTSEICRRLIRPKFHGSKDGVGYDFNMNNSFGIDALTNNTNDSLVNDQRDLKNLSHTASGWLEKEYHDKYGITQANLWSKDKERLNFEADPVVLPPSYVPLDLPYGTNSECYDPSKPGIVGYATVKNSRHDLGAPNIDLMGSASFTANCNHGLREEIIHVGGYVSDALPSETVQPFPDEHNGTSMDKTSSLGLDYYIPMPIEHREYQTNTGMIGGSCSVSESRNGHLCHSLFPGLLISAGATENMRKFERLSFSNHNIFPSFDNPLPSRDLSPKDELTNEILAHQHQEEYGGHVSYTNDMVVRGSSIYPSFTLPSTLGDGADLYAENITHNEVKAYQRHEEFGSDAFDSNNRVSRMKDRDSPVEFERKKARKSVFSRLATPSKECDAEKESSPDTESVDEVMAFLNDCHKHWMEQKSPSIIKAEYFGKHKKKKEKFHTSEVQADDLMFPLTEPTTDDLLDCEENMEHSAQKLQFIDFKRRSKAQKNLGNLTQGSEDDSKHLASPNKKRKLLRPKLIEDDLEKKKISVYP